MTVPAYHRLTGTAKLNTGGCETAITPNPQTGSGSFGQINGVYKLGSEGDTGVSCPQHMSTVDQQILCLVFWVKNPDPKYLPPQAL